MTHDIYYRHPAPTSVCTRACDGFVFTECLDYDIVAQEERGADCTARRDAWSVVCIDAAAGDARCISFCSSASRKGREEEEIMVNTAWMYRAPL